MEQSNLTASEKQEAVIQGTKSGYEDAILPEGWTGEGDFFEPETWGGAADVDAQRRSSNVESGLDENAAAIAEALTNELGGEPEASESGEGNEDLHTKQDGADESTLKFKAQLDHNDVDVELSRDELPAVWQKAQIVDRVQDKLKKVSERVSRMDKLAKYLEYEDIDDFYKGTVDNLIEQEKEALLRQGTPSAIAEDYASRKVADLLKDVPTAPEPKDEQTGQPAKRDFSQELQELWREYPQTYGKQLPDDVVKLTSGPNGKSLLRAYESYVARKDKDELDTLRKEIKKLRQTTDAARRAPVRGVTSGGATNKDPDDPFLAGFNYGY